MAAHHRANGANRVPPHNLQAEQSLLGDMLLSKDAIEDAIGIVTADAFYSQNHQVVFSTILTLHSRGEPADPITVAEELTRQVTKNGTMLDEIGGPATLTDLQSAPGAIGSAKRYARIVAEHHTARQVAGIGEEIRELGLAGPSDLAETLARVKELAARVDEASGLVGAGFKRIDIGSLMRQGVPKPTMVHPWLYAGGLHSLHAEPGVAKTWAALWLSMQVMESGFCVVYLDEENGEELITERLVLLGADPKMCDERFHYYAFESRSWTAADIAGLGSVLAQAAPVGLGVLDSLADFLAAADMDEDKSMEVTRFVHRLLPPFRDAGAALLVLDHLTKASESSGRKRSRYSRGSGAKLGKVHGTILVETVKEFDAVTSGQIRCWKTKDRRGRLDLPKMSQPALLLDVNVGRGSVRFEKAEVQDSETGEGLTDEQKVAEARAAVLDVLKSAPGNEFNGKQLEGAVRSTGFRKGVQFIRQAALDLAADNAVSHRRGGSGKTAAHIYSWRPDGQVSPQEIPIEDDDDLDDEPF